MSYILQALQKSEQERHRGEVPDLQTVSTPAQPARRGITAWPWVAGGLVAINLAVLVLWLGSGPSQSEQPVTRAGAATQTGQAAPATKANKDHSPESNPGSQSGQNSPQTADAKVAPQPEQDEPAAATKDDASTTSPVADTRSKPQPPTQSKGADRGPGIPARSSTSVAGAQETDTAPPHTKTAPRSGDAPAGYEGLARASTATPPSKPAQPSSGPTQPDTSKAGNTAGSPPPDVPSRYGLPDKIRRALPDIQISVHVFAEAPERRKVRINGRMLQEGDEVAPELMLERITRSGVVLRYRDRAFHMQAI